MTSPRNTHPYKGARIALLTQHAKEQVLGPLFAAELGAALELVRGFDTDTLGTFTRETPRLGTQIEAARRKAEIAIERSGAACGLGSEGAFVPGPFGLGSWNIEVVVLVDRTSGIEVVGRAGAPGRHLHATLRSREELREFADRAGFPGHGLVVRPDNERDPRMRKGIARSGELEVAFDEALRRSGTGAVFVESELRAHLNPTRMETIRAAGRDLTIRLREPCPACGAPGFGIVAKVPGLPCSECGAPTREAIADELGCVRCDFREERALADSPSTASPAVCDYCNP